MSWVDYVSIFLQVLVAIPAFLIWMAGRALTARLIIWFGPPDPPTLRGPMTDEIVPQAGLKVTRENWVQAALVVGLNPDSVELVVKTFGQANGCPRLRRVALMLAELEVLRQRECGAQLDAGRPDPPAPARDSRGAARRQSPGAGHGAIMTESKTPSAEAMRVAEVLREVGWRDELALALDAHAEAVVRRVLGERAAHASDVLAEHEFNTVLDDARIALIDEQDAHQVTLDNLQATAEALVCAERCIYQFIGERDEARAALERVKGELAEERRKGGLLFESYRAAMPSRRALVESAGKKPEQPGYTDEQRAADVERVREELRAWYVDNECPDSGDALRAAIAALDRLAAAPQSPGVPGLDGCTHGDPDGSPFCELCNVSNAEAQGAIYAAAPQAEPTPERAPERAPERTAEDAWNGLPESTQVSLAWPSFVAGYNHARVEAAMERQAEPTPCPGCGVGMTRDSHTGEQECSSPSGCPGPLPTPERAKGLLPSSPEERSKLWESALQLLRDKGVDVEALLKQGAKNIELHYQAPEPAPSPEPEREIVVGSKWQHRIGGVVTVASVDEDYVHILEANFSAFTEDFRERHTWLSDPALSPPRAVPAGETP